MARPKRTAGQRLKAKEQAFLDLWDDPALAAKAITNKRGVPTEIMLHLGATNAKMANDKAQRMMKRAPVAAAIEEKAKLKREAEEERKKAEAKELGRRQAVTKADVMALLWKQANTPNLNTNGTMNAQVRASIALSEILGMKIGPQNPDKFDGFTDAELEQFVKDGTVPERFASRFGLPPGGSSQIM